MARSRLYQSLYQLYLALAVAPQHTCGIAGGAGEASRMTGLPSHLDPMVHLAFLLVQ